MSATDPLLLGFVLAAKAVTELFILLLLARGAVAVLSFGRPQANPVWQLLHWVTGPTVRLARRLAPAGVIDRHLPLLALVLCAWCWVALVMLKAALQ